MVINEMIMAMIKIIILIEIFYRDRIESLVNLANTSVMRIFTEVQPNISHEIFSS